MLNINKKGIALKNFLIFLHVLFAIVGLYTYLVTYHISEDLLIQKTLNKQLVLAKAGSLSIENLLRSVQSELYSFAFSFDKTSEGEVIDKDITRAGLVSYIQRSQLPVSGVALFDENGKVAILENRSHVREGEGEDFSEAEFIKWSKEPINKGKIFLSTPLLGTVGASKGKIILVMAEPIYFGSKFKGTLAIRLRVEDFTKAYVTPLISDSTEDTFIVNQNGVVIAGRDSLLNTNLFDYAKKLKWSNYEDFIRKLQLAFTKNETQTVWTSQLPGEKPRKMLVGISKIDLPGTDKDLYIKVATPAEGVLDSLSGLRKYGYIWLGVGALTTIVASLIVLRFQS